MAFAPKPGCPLCGIVASAFHDHTTLAPSFPLSPTSPSSPTVLWRDDNFTAYREKANPVSSKGHIIIAFNLHVPSLYTLSSTDLPLLVNVRNIAIRLLTALDTTPDSRAASPSTPTFPSSTTPLENNPRFRIGFITPPFKDNKIPVTDHLHAHAYIEPSDLMGWWRGLAYGPLAWYAIDDLIAEIRESVSNNRVKSGYENRKNAPIDFVPQAGARTGTPAGVDQTPAGLSRTEPDLEDGERSPLPTSASPFAPSPTSTIAPQSAIRV